MFHANDLKKENEVTEVRKSRWIWNWDENSRSDVQPSKSRFGGQATGRDAQQCKWRLGCSSRSYLESPESARIRTGILSVLLSKLHKTETKL